MSKVVYLTVKISKNFFRKRKKAQTSSNYLSFYSFNDLQVQMKRYLYRSNNIPMSVLGWKSPNQKQRELGGR